MGSLISCLCCFGVPDDDHDEPHTQPLNSSNPEGCQCIGNCIHKATTNKRNMHQLTAEEHASLHSGIVRGNFSTNGGESTADRSTPSNNQQNASPLQPQVIGGNSSSNEITPDRSASLEEGRSGTSEPGRAGQSSKSGVKAEAEGVESFYSLPVLDDEDVCPTCLDEYDDENPKITVKCLHHFHLGCIYDWMERSPSCPVCREVLLFLDE